MSRLALISCALAAVLAGCATTPARRVVCPSVTPYSAAEQNAAADELERLPEGSTLARFVIDYGRLRAAARACAE